MHGFLLQSSADGKLRFTVAHGGSCFRCLCCTIGSVTTLWIGLGDLPSYRLLLLKQQFLKDWIRSCQYGSSQKMVTTLSEVLDSIDSS